MTNARRVGRRSALIALSVLTGQALLSGQDQYPKPDFSGVSQWYELLRYNYDVLKGYLYMTVKLKTDVHPDCAMEFLDADGVRVFQNPVLTHFAAYHAGEVVKEDSGMPRESEMATVKRVVVTRIIH